MVQFIDAVTLKGTRITRDGYLVAEANIARTGIQIYQGREVGRQDLANVRVYRSPEQVFSQTAMGSFAHRPITIDHPKGMVDAKNWKKVSVGQLGDNVMRDGDHVRVPLVLMDADAIADVQGGKRELSCGYICDLDWTPGTTPEGEAYDAQQMGIVGNHLAIVERGRAGAGCRIGDSWTAGLAPLEPETTAQSARAVASLTSQLGTADALGVEKAAALAALRAGQLARVGDLRNRLASLQSAQAGTMAAKDAEIIALKAAQSGEVAAKEAELAVVRLQSVGDAFDVLVAQRGAMLAAAHAVLGDGYGHAGRSDEQIRRDVVAKALGAGAVRGKCDSFVRGAFEVIARTSSLPRQNSY
jgi:hypothetical protein